MRCAAVFFALPHTLPLGHSFNSFLMFAPQPQSSSMAGTSKLHPDVGTFCRKISLHKHPRFFLTRLYRSAILGFVN
jgi:hypothetical protein